MTSTTRDANCGAAAIPKALFAVSCCLSKSVARHEGRKKSYDGQPHCGRKKIAGLWEWPREWHSWLSGEYTAKGPTKSCLGSVACYLTAKSETMGPLIAVFEDRADFICNSWKLMPNFKIFAVIKN